MVHSKHPFPTGQLDTKHLSPTKGILWEPILGAHRVSHTGNDANHNSSASIQMKYKQRNQRFNMSGQHCYPVTWQYEPFLRYKNTWLTLKGRSWGFIYRKQPRTPHHGWVLFWLLENMADPSHMIAATSIKCCNSKKKKRLACHENPERTAIRNRSPFNCQQSAKSSGSEWVISLCGSWYRTQTCSGRPKMSPRGSVTSHWCLQAVSSQGLCRPPRK